MLNIFAEVEQQGALTSAELYDLNVIVTNASALNLTGEARFETSELVTTVYTTYQDNQISGLAVGSPASLQAELVDKWFLGMDHPVASGTYTVDNGNLFVNGTPSYLNVHQDNLGDCWLLSSLVEVAAREPALIKSMFTFDGTTPEMVTNARTQVSNVLNVDVWTVRFYSNYGTPVYITVDSELPAGGTLYDHPSVTGTRGNGALWVALAEKAYVQANGDGFVTSNLPDDNVYEALDGGSPESAITAIAGLSANYNINPTNVSAAWNAGSLVVMTTGRAPRATTWCPTTRMPW